jgi:GTPase SAR1 family protein
MGLCGAKLGDSRGWEKSQEIDMQLAEERRRRRRQQQTVVKLLLLGAGESGKSTIFKQMQILHGKGFKGSTALAYVEVIYRNLFKNMMTLIRGAEKLGIGINARAERDRFLQLDRRNPTLGADDVALFKALWADDGIQKTYAQRSVLQVADSTAYYLEAIDRLARPDYVPTEQDILRARIRTSGIIEEHFLIGREQNDFAIIDVGGQRNERRKWIHCFDDVTAVIFVAALSEYDQVLYEDRHQNRMVEAVQLFKEIVNCKFFSSTSMILFLNKADLFAEKIKTVDIRQPMDEWTAEEEDDAEAKRGVEGPSAGRSVGKRRGKKKVKRRGFFMDYEGGCDEQKGIEYFSKLFARQNRKKSRKIFTHVTTATNTQNVNKVFEACRAVLMKEQMEKIGYTSNPMGGGRGNRW